MGQRSSSRGGWQQWTEREARAALAELAAWRGTVEEFVRTKGISKRRISYWRQRLSPTKPPAFVAVSVARGDRVRADSAARIEIAIGELIVRVREDIDEQRLSSILDVLERRRPSEC